MKSIFYGLCSAFFVLSLFGSIAHGFSDVPSSSSLYRAITFLEKKNIIEGYTDNTFRPANTISRAEFLAIVLRGAGINPNNTYRDCYADVRNEWFAPYVCYAARQGWVDGNQTRFRPHDIVNRAEGAKMLLEVFDIELLTKNDGRFIDCRDNSCTQWYGDYANTLKGRNLFDFDLFHGDYALTRGEMAEMVFRTYIIEDFEVVKYHPSQGELYARTNGIFTLPDSYENSSYSYSYTYGEETAFEFTTKPVQLSLSQTNNESYLQNRNAPFLQLDADTRIYAGYTESTPGEWDPILIRFDNGRRTWARNDYETQRFSKSYAYGVFELYGNLYVLFATQGSAGSSQTDYRRASTDGWIKEYGADSGKGEFVTVIGKISGTTGAMEYATYITGINPATNKTATTLVTDLVEQQGQLKATAITTGVPKTPELKAITAVDNQAVPRTFHFLMPLTLGKPGVVEAGGRSYFSE